MPRPVIIKIKDNSDYSEQVSVSSMDAKRFRKISKPESVDEPYTYEEVETKSLVRNLIHQYEFSNFSKTNLTKSKSMPHLAKPKPTIRRPSQVEIPSDIVGEKQRDNNGFNFKQIWSKFETFSNSDNKTLNNKVTIQKSVTKIDFDNVQQKAKALLNDYRDVDQHLWQDHVVLFLKEICNMDNDSAVGTNEKKAIDNPIVSIKSNEGATEKSDKVKEIANLFERQISVGTLITKPKASYTMYFSNMKNNAEVVDVHKDESSTESELSDDSQGSLIFQHLDTASSMKIMELKSYFEPSNDGASEKVDGVNGARLLPLPTILKQDNEEAMKKIQALIEQIEKHQNRIEHLSKDDGYEGSQINEHLIQTLIKLDDIETFNNTSVQAGRKKAILLVQSCIRTLIEKLRG